METDAVTDHVASIAGTFDRSAGDGHGDRMALGHWPRTRQIIERMALEPGNTVLDVGCGTGHALRAMAKVIKPDGKACGVDISKGMIQRAIDLSRAFDNVTYEYTQATRLPFENDTFDHILSVEMLYYAEDMKRVLLEMQRVLKPGGFAWVMVDCYQENTVSEAWLDLFEVPIHFLKEAAYQTLFEAAGFQQVKTCRLFDDTPVDVENFKPSWGFKAVEDVIKFRTEIGSLLITGQK